MNAKSAWPSGALTFLNGPRALPFAIAAISGALVALILGYTAWYFFGTHRTAAIDESPALTAAETLTAPAATVSEMRQPVVLAPAGELPVAPGLVTLGSDTDDPIRKMTVGAFAIAETEVTNDQYYQFIKETNHKTPATWKKAEYPPGTANDPVTNITWQDAADYCAWLTGKIGAVVRLPSEAEWELAARGPNGWKYPWGNEWDSRAASGAEDKGQPRAVKSYPVNRSPCGAYDMAGNVWEWIADEAHDSNGDPVVRDGVTLRLAKGGSAGEPLTLISGSARTKLPPQIKDSFLGFRYVVLRVTDDKRADPSR